MTSSASSPSALTHPVSSAHGKSHAAAKLNTSHSLWLGFFVIALVYLATIGFFPLLGRDEPRYAQVAREMWQSGDWMTPKLGGFPWFEKPVLLYWLLAVSYAIFGVSEWAARLAPALCGVGTVVLLWWMLRRVRCDWAKWSALALATSGGMLFFSHGVTFDILVTCCVTLALTGFGRAQSEMGTPQQRRYLAMFWGGIGLAFLAKGPAAFALCLGTVALYAILRRERIHLGWKWGLPLALLLGAIWYGPVIWQNGWPSLSPFFLWYPFASDSLEPSRHSQPLWCDLPMLLILSLPWAPVLLVALAQLRPASLCENNRESRLRALAFAWMVVPILLFSVSRSKLPGDLLPALPGAFILVGACLAEWTRGKLARLASVGLALFMLLGSALATTTRSGIARAEDASVRSLMREAEVAGCANMRLVELHTTQRSAQFYAPHQLIYDELGEPLRFQTPEPLASRVQSEPLLVLTEAKFAKRLIGVPGVRVQKIGHTGELFLLVVRAMQTER